MKRWSLFFFLLSALMSLYAQDYKTVSLRFSPEDYKLTKVDGGGQLITSDKQDETYIPRGNEPAIPYIPISIKVSIEKRYISHKYTFSRRQFADDIDLTNNPICVPTIFQHQLTYGATEEFDKRIYPDDNIIYTGTSNYDNYAILNFLISPWIYDAQKKQLEIMTSIDLKIELSSTDTSVKPSNAMSRNLNEFTNALVLNNSEFINDSNERDLSNNDSDKYEYIVVTSSFLSSYFEPLIRWKTQKGVHAKIITTEEIDSLYSGSTSQLRIKNCLFDYYSNYGLQYVLLGGDDTIVPVQGCYAVVNAGMENQKEDFAIPSDIFYSSFGGEFSWDGDGDLICGEVEDNIDFTPYIYITRIPVRSSSHVTTFVNKVIGYEKEPDTAEWNNNILMCGTKLWNYCSDDPSKSDAQAKSENLYNLAIYPYWTGSRDRFYDTFTDFGGTTFDLTSTNLQSKLSLGYTFMDIATHGSVELWSMEVGTGYNINNALQLINPMPTIITTMACNTNAFDNYYTEPCLSEAFLRNSDNNIIAYWGCSRYGWGYNTKNSTLGPSLQYEKKYFERLFGSSIQEKNWGRIIANAKASLVNNSSYNGAYRWLQLGLNPIGDPEMPVFINTPIEFNHSSITYNNGGFTVNTGEPGCKICIMSSSNNGDSVYEVYRDVQIITKDSYDEDLSVCITKQGFIPKIYHILHTIYVQNDIIGVDTTYEAKEILVGTNVTPVLPSGNVVIENCNVTMRADEISIYPNTEIKVGTSLSIENR